MFKITRKMASFNEAGAINAGKRSGSEGASGGRSSFNEAGAINAGKLAGDNHVVAVVALASMRPAQLTPENVNREAGT